MTKGIHNRPKIEVQKEYREIYSQQFFYNEYKTIIRDKECKK